MKRLAPSLTDFVFLAILFWLFLADPTAWERLVRDGDTALHTRIGDWILDHGRVPKTGIFALTIPDDRWFAMSWLSGVIYALLNRAAGLKGIVWLAAMTIALTHVIVLRDSVRRGANGIVALLIVFIAANAALVHGHARPHLFTLLFLAVMALLLARDRDEPSNAVWWIVPLIAVWSNLHSGYPAALAMLAVAAVGDWSRRYALLTAASAVATAVNPNGLALLKFIAGFASSEWTRNNISEYQPPTFGSEQMYLAAALLIAGAHVAIRAALERRWTEAMWLGGFGAASLISARHMPLYLVVAAPLIAVELSRWWRRSPLADLDPSPALRAPGPWTAAVAAAVWMFAGGWPRDLSAEFPRDLVRRNAAPLAAARVFTEDQWADYLLWVNYPAQRVFFDGRSDFYGEKLGADYLMMLGAGATWREVARKHAFDAILTPPESPLASAVARDPAWRLADHDALAALYVKAGGSSDSGTALPSAAPNEPAAR